MTRAFVLSLLLVSGAAGLVYELVWAKRLANVLGSSGQAHALVLAVFMGGLALGAWAFGRLADRTRRPVLLYGLLELFVGLYALAFEPILDALTRAYLLWGGGVLAAKLGLAALALVPPTLAMGGTVPVLTRFFTRAMRDARAELSLLYAINSLGAALGVLAAGLWMVPAIGLSWTERSAGVANLLLALVAGAVGRKAVAPVAAQEGGPAGDGGSARLALICVALTGFCSMVFEITWVRVLAVVIGGTTYAFTLTLAAFICGVALGSLWVSYRAESADDLRFFSRLQLLLMASVCVTAPLFGRLPYHFMDLWGSMERTAATWPLFQLKTFWICCAIVVVPTFFVGASFPVAARVALRDAALLGRQLGRVYLWNTVGTVGGSLLGGLWLLSAIGLEGNLWVGLLATAAAALVAVRARRPGTWVAIAALVGLSLFTRGWSTDLLSSGRYREWNRRFESFEAFRVAGARASRVIFQGHDVFASVLVGETPGGMRYMRINGKVDCSTGPDVDTQALASHVGALLSGRPVKRVLVVGMCAGVTVASVLAHPVEHVDVIEISPKVLEASDLFADFAGHPRKDPRLHVYVDDAKTFLAAQREKYDLIISVPSNPWVSGVSGLFSRDFFRVVKERLAPGGQLVQWIHAYESTRDLVRLVLRTVRDSLPYCTTWLGAEDLLLVASAFEPALDFAAIDVRLREGRVGEDLRKLGIASVLQLLSRQVHSDQGQRRFAGEGPINTDDRNRLEFDSPVAYFTGSTVEFEDQRLDEQGRAQLLLARYLGRPPTCPEAEAIHNALAAAHLPGDPVLRRAQADLAGCVSQPP